MYSIETLMVLVPGLPLAAALLTAALGKSVLGRRSHWPLVIALAVSFAASVALVAALESHEPGGHPPIGVEKLHTLWTWASVQDAYQPPGAGRGFDFRVDITLRADPLTAVMLAMVTFVSLVVAVYSIGYMHGDPGYWRFFTYVSLFVFSMTMLVSVSNFVLLYVFWEAVGLSSYLLIGFWFERPAAAAAGKKAFLVNRVGDFGFALAVFLIWTTYGTLNFHDVGPEGTPAIAGDPLATAGVLGQERLGDPSLFVGGPAGLAIALGLLVGACGKSAQFPLHVWLPDAMEGPTPVSALIHAATMVTAGVYLVARCTPLVAVSPDAQAAVAGIGCFTALLAAVIALAQTDLKRVLAYSTISQLGYMFLALGTGTLAGVTAGMFHLVTHGFFKALLFLGAGSVMHAMGGASDMRRLGGLRHVLPWTHLTFWFGCLALAGVAPLAGFWSKDAILAAVYDRTRDDFLLRFDVGLVIPLFGVLYWVALSTALLTAVYTFRALFLTFYGQRRIPPEAGHHAHESPSVMILPLVLLAACALVVGAFFEATHGLADLLERTPILAYDPLPKAGAQAGFHGGIAAASTAVVLAGIALAAFLYLGGRNRVELVARLARSGYGLRMYQLSSGKFFFDQVYEFAIVRPLRAAAAGSYWLDRWVIDGLANLFGRVPLGAGSLLRALQNGMVQFYALAMMLGLLVLMGALWMWPGRW